MSLARTAIRTFHQLKPSTRGVHITHHRPRPSAPSSSSSSSLSGSRSTSSSSAHHHPHSHTTHPPHSGSNGTHHAGSNNGGAKKPSPHLVWYREIVPAMVPILLLSSTIFLSLTLLRTHLSHARALSESTTRIAELEHQLEILRRRQARQRERDRKERERILPMVVERVLQKVGAMNQDEEEEEELPLLV